MSERSGLMDWGDPRGPGGWRGVLKAVVSAFLASVLVTVLGLLLIS